LTLANPLAGVLFCAKCGHALRKTNHTHADVRYACVYNTPICMKSIKMKEVIEAVITALEEAELPNLKAKMDSGQGNSAAIQQKILDNLMKQMAEYKEQEETQYELLETKKYTPELFEKRNAALREKMKQCEIQIEETRRTMPEPIDYAERIIALEDAIKAMRDDNLSCEEKNKFLKKIVGKITIETFPLPKRNTGCTLDIDLIL
jgi:transketolase